MQFLGSLLVSIRQKRSREQDVLLAHPSPHMAVSLGCGSDEQLLEGYGLLHAAAGGSSAKRRRSDPHFQRQAHAAAAACAPPPHCQSQCRPLAGPVYVDNPLFDVEGQEVEEGTREVCNAQQEAWLDGENTPLPHKLGGVEEGADSQDQFADYTPCSSDDVLAAFMRQLSSTHLLCALARLHQCDLHPVGSGEYCSLDGTIAGLLVLCRRAALGADEISPELLLTILWLMEGTGSQYRRLENCIHSYLCLHPDNSGELAERLKGRMLELQIQVLTRCSWRVLLLDRRELLAALRELGGHPDYDRLCEFVEECAEENYVPFVGANYQGDRLDAAGAAMDRSRAPYRSRPQSAGLDGSYWQLQLDGQPQREPVAAPHPPAMATRSGRQLRSVLGPHNR